MTDIDTNRLVFTDEKSLKGVEIFNKKGRQDPFSGTKLVEYVTRDFRNVYCIMGLIYANPQKKKPLVYSMGK